MPSELRARARALVSTPPTGMMPPLPISSCTFFAGSDGCTTSTLGRVASSVTWAKWARRIERDARHRRQVHNFIGHDHVHRPLRIALRARRSRGDQQDPDEVLHCLLLSWA